MASSISNTRMSREDFKKAKELEELRKTGAAPPELDEDGKMINPHIPQYVSQAPWYLNQNRPGLKHQYTKHFGGGIQYDKLDKFYLRGARAPQKESSKKFRKGACENCGAMTHKTKECVERPRKKGAKLTNSDIAPDEHVHEKLVLDYDGKRDRWAGYDPSQYKQVIQKFQETDEERAKRRRAKIQEKMRDKEGRRARRKLKKQQEGNEDGSDQESDTDSDTEDEGAEEDVDEDLLAAKQDDGQMFGKAMDNHKGGGRTTARNLRIREDTAKYLLNLDIKSAHYDPKTRSMRSNPHPERDPSEGGFSGDNFVRRSGDVRDTSDLQRFVWQANEKGGIEEVHMEATPSQAAQLYKSYKEKLESLKTDKKDSILEKYGGAEHLEAPDKLLLLGESEAYVEYSQSGKVIKGLEEAIPKTKYAEDILENNHTEIWGSYFAKNLWGYACCNLTIRNAYCTGEAGRIASATGAQSLGDAEQPTLLIAPPPAPPPPTSTSTSASVPTSTKPPVPLFSQPSSSSSSATDSAPPPPPPPSSPPPSSSSKKRKSRGATKGARPPQKLKWEAVAVATELA
eukprot:gb/GEZN01004396.1/.p1 GENE.gb/GEZN01004396.1/~~gb/GEZN01004396.1/.p1  ORF type:complete len:569 (-),score=124.62 gb/GEZN01004396.1/:183-1889(-)